MSAIVKGAALFGAYFFRLPRCAKPEERLTTRCADFLRLAAPPDLFFTHIPNEAKRSPVGHFIQECMGRQVGMQDLHMLFRGAAFYVEIKVKGKKPTAEQLDCARRIVLAGGRCAIVDTFEDFVRQCKAWGLIPN